MLELNAVKRIFIFFAIAIFSCCSIWCNEALFNKWKTLCDLLEQNSEDEVLSDSAAEILEMLSNLETEDSLYENLAQSHKEFQMAVEELNLEKIRQTYPAYILEKNKTNKKSGQVYGIFVLIFSIFIFLVILLTIVYQSTIGRMKKETENANIILQTQEDERKRISLELHDGVAQKMRYIEMLSSRIGGKDAKEISALQTECINEIRSICYNLHSPDIERGDLQSAIHMLVIDFNDKTKIKADFYAEENVDYSFLSLNEMHDVFRIVQEALSNIAKHANASEVVVFMRNSKNKKKGNALVVIVTDNGTGLPDDMQIPPPRTKIKHCKKIA